MEGTPQIALMLLVLGLLTWAWPRSLPNQRMDDLRRWLPLVGWTWAMLSRISAAFNPTQWPHFAARLGAEATLFERLAAVVSGDGLVLIGMAVPLWWTALDRHEDSAWRRAEVVLPWRFSPCLVSKAVWNVASSPTAPRSLRRGGTGSSACLCWLWCSVDGMSCRFNEPLRTCIAGHPWCSYQWWRPTLACKQHVDLGCWPPPQPSRWPSQVPASVMAAPQGLAVWLVLSMVLSVVMMLALLPPYGGFEAWAVVGVVLRTVTVVAATTIAALLSLRLGLDAQAQATWSMGRRAWSITPMMLLVCCLQCRLWLPRCSSVRGRHGRCFGGGLWVWKTVLETHKRPSRL